MLCSYEKREGGRGRVIFFGKSRLNLRNHALVPTPPGRPPARSFVASRLLKLQQLRSVANRQADKSSQAPPHLRREANSRLSPRLSFST
jgi:hypothetical protein